MKKFSHIVTEDDAREKLPVRRLIRRYFNFSSRLREKIKRENLVFINGKPVAGWIVPKQGDVLEIHLPKERSFFEPEDIPIDVIFEDEDLLVINKAPGIVVHPTYGYKEHTVANAVTKYMLDTNQEFKIRFINRIDMDTSGLLLLGKNSHAQDSYMKQQKSGDVKKIYIALVKGIVKSDAGIIDAPIGKPDITKAQRGVTPEGKPSITRYKVLERFDYGYTLLEAELQTGRTHQIRVHLDYIGHTILGDEFYGDKNQDLISRQALHAAYLSFKHPTDEKILELRAPLPDDMKKLTEKIRKMNT